MNNVFVAFIVASVLLSAEANANDLISLPQGNMACTVTVQAESTEASADKATSSTAQSPTPKGLPSIKTIEITRVGRLRRDIVTWSDSNTSEAWTLSDIGMTLVEKNVGPSKLIYQFPRSAGARNSLVPIILDFDPASTAWITPETRLPAAHGLASFQGQSSIHYQVTVNSPDSYQVARHVLYQAWLDPKTLIPVALDDGDHVYKLSFSPKPPTDPLVLPDRFKTDLQKYQNANASIRHL